MARSTRLTRKLQSKMQRKKAKLERSEDLGTILQYYFKKALNEQEENVPAFMIGSFNEDAETETLNEQEENVSAFKIGSFNEATETETLNKQAETRPVYNTN